MSLTNAIHQQLDALEARSTLYARHLPSGQEITIRADEPVNTLSVIKLPIMVLAYQDADACRLDLTERYTIRPEDMRRGSGLLQTFDPGLQPTYRDLVAQMIITSDNTATDIMIARLGQDRINAMLAELDYTETRLLGTTNDLFLRVWELADPANAKLSPREVFDRGFPTDPDAHERSFAFASKPSEWLGRSTARETGRLLQQLFEGRLASPQATEAMQTILKQQFYTSRLPRNIGDRVQIGHKTGDWPPIAGNDVGIVYSENGPIVISVFITHNRGPFSQLEAAHGRIAELLLEGLPQA